MDLLALHFAALLRLWCWKGFCGATSRSERRPRQQDYFLVSMKAILLGRSGGKVDSDC